MCSNNPQSDEIIFNQISHLKISKIMEMRHPQPAGRRLSSGPSRARLSDVGANVMSILSF